MDIADRLKALKLAEYRIKELEFDALDRRSTVNEETILGNMREMNYLNDKVSKLMRMMTKSYDLKK